MTTPIKTRKTKKATRCEGFRRYGGAFTLGPVHWEQCKANGIVTLKFKDGSKVKTLPACQECWNDCLENEIEIIEARPIRNAH